MQHLAIDLGGRQSQICVRDETQKILTECRVATARLGTFLKKQPFSRVIVETCAESFHIADQALEHGHEVRVVPATLVRSLGVGSRGIKTDKRDARILSEVSCRVNLPSVHIPSAMARELKSQCGQREILVGCRTKLINAMRGWMRGKALRLAGGATNTFTQRLRSRFHKDGNDIPDSVARHLIVIDTLSLQIAACNKEFKTLATNNDVAVRLMTVPGVGPVTALRFLATIDEIQRFPSAHAVQSYIGLTPGEHSSSDKKRRTSITKAGARQLRWALVQAAWGARNSKTAVLDPMIVWSLSVERRRGKNIAIVGLARKIAGILYALWRDGTCYQAQHV